ncbi:phosphoglycerate mutase-like protein [Xylariaceae sp. FL0662B]|nr:phosphoglycerate mutase-like protein [Xylariaceae sp. FL0662B]
MSLEVIYVTRHGFRSPWLVDPSTGDYTASIRSPTGLPTDPALAAHGVEQAEELAAHLLKLNPPIEQVYSSPYFRCLQTLQPFVRKRVQSSANAAAELPFKIRADPGLGEWYGVASFEHPTPAPLNKLQTFFPELDADYVSALAPSSNGESISQLYDRVAGAIDTIVTRSDQEGRKAVLISTHAAVVISLGRILTGRLPEDVQEEDFHAYTCGLSVYRRQGGNRKKAVLGADDRTESSNVRGMTPDALGVWREGQIGEARSNAYIEPDHARYADHHPQNSRENDPGPSWRGGPRTSGGWICEANSDCSFLRCGEERGWKFSGDEAFINIEGLSPSDAGSAPSTSVDRTRLESRGSHIEPVAGTPKL